LDTLTSETLAGRTIVVTRAVERAGSLATKLTAHGATVLSVATIAPQPPLDEGAALRKVLREASCYQVIVVTSAEGAQRVAAEVPYELRSSLPVAAVGPSTAARVGELGFALHTVPAQAHGKALVAALGRGNGRVLVAQADIAPSTVVDGLRANGWTVDAVTAYRTLPVAIPDELREQCRRADAITFASGSAVTNFIAAAGIESVPAIVVCIGPSTLEVAHSYGLMDAAMADPHTLDGLVAATITACAR
jgi:uroporphyrinogen-III synthase